MKRLLLSICVVLASLSAMAEKGTIVLHTPCEYQIMYISENGKWATGVYYDYSYNPYTFRWNLESGEIEMLSTQESSNPSGISNVGVVASNFLSHDISPNGAGVDAPGWYDTRWHTLPLNGDFINGSSMGMSMGGGISGGISPDGQWMAGSSYIKGNLHPVIWKNGEFYKDAYDGYTGVPYTISSDGNHIAGWKYRKENPGQRYACVWLNGSKNASYLSTFGSPWSFAEMFSYDGKKLLFWGGYVSNNPEDPSDIKALYDMATGTVSPLRCITQNPFDEGFHSISNNGVILGHEQTADVLEARATIYVDGKGYWATDYLKEKGIYDFSTDPEVMNDPDVSDYPLVIRGMGLSADAKAMGFFHYEPSGYYKSTVLLLDQEITHRAPCGLKGSQLDGTGVVRLAWKKPLVNAENVERYVVYQDGVKVAESSELICFIKDVTKGEYSYSVSAVYKDGTESDKTDAVSVSIKEKSIQTPYSLIARQNGFNNASLIWTAPRTNKVTKSYYDASESDIVGFGAAESFELAVRFDKSDINFYEGGTIEGVSFYPLSTQMGWKATVYEYDEATNKYTVIKQQNITQDLVYGELNTVLFDEPLAIDAKKDIVIGITAIVNELTANENIIGMVYGKRAADKSDLLRKETEPAFYSFYDVVQQQGATYECSWAISAIINNGTVSADADKVAQYNVFSDGTFVNNVTTESAKVLNLTEGQHTLGVEAVYADGSKSNVESADVKIDIDEDFFSVKDVAVDSKQTDSKVSFSWNAPVDNDRNFIAYCQETASDNEVHGTSDKNWALQGMVEYDSKMLRPYAGSQIKKFRFYPTCDAEFTFSLRLNDNDIAYVEVYDYELNKWNEVELEEPITILPGLTYELILDCYDTTPEESPIGIDGASPFTGVSDLVSVDGDEFQSLSESGIFGNWMFGMVTEGESNELVINGYNVLVDGEQKNAQPLTETSYTYDFGEVKDAKHTVRVDAIYANQNKTIEGKDVAFATGDPAAGISNNVMQNQKSNRSSHVYNVAGQRVTKPSVGLFVQKKQKTLYSGHKPLDTK